MTTLVSLDGQLMPPERATVSVFDRGFLYGDSVYEVIRTYDGIPFELGLHLERLAGSAARVGMELPVSLDVIADETRRTHRATGNAESYLRVVVTRGAGELGLDPGLAERPLRVVIAKTLTPPPPDTYAHGVELALVSVRRNLREAIDPQAKTGNYLNSVLAVAEAKRRGAYEALMLDHRGLITEGASSNVFVVVGGVVLTPPLDAGILKGVTRHVVFEVARGAGIRTLEVPLTPETLEGADEAFITSSIRELVPVARVDGRAVGAGAPGPVTAALRAGIAAYVRAHNASGGR